MNVNGNPTALAARRARRGFSLGEMLAVMVGLQVFLTLVVGVLWAAIRIERAAAADFERTLVQGALADQFRADVAGAASVPKKLGLEDAGPTCLILRRPNGKYVIYSWDGERLIRTVKSDALRSQQMLPLGAEKAAVEFTQSGSGSLITLRLTETRGQGSAQRSGWADITAALGGDLQ